MARKRRPRATSAPDRRSAAAAPKNDAGDATRKGKEREDQGDQKREAEERQAQERQIDETLEESFPSSDPPSWTTGK